MLKHPVFGVGPDHWPLIAPEYGWPLGKEAHTLWLQIGAEMGFVGLGILLSFYLLCMARLWPLTRERSAAPDPFLRDVARMVVAALVGYVVAAQFVTIIGLEVSYYITLVGAGALKLASVPASAPVPFPRRGLAFGVVPRDAAAEQPVVHGVVAIAGGLRR
jgi:O-antigen ligase